MADNSEKIANFCAITGAAAYQAEQYLEAHEYDLERAIDFYLEHPPQEHPPLEAEDAAGQQPAVQQPVAPALYEQDFVQIADDDEDAALSELARQRERAMEARQHAQQQMEGMMGEAHDMMRRAGIDMMGIQGQAIPVPAAVAGSRARRARVPAPGAADLMDTGDDDEVDALEAAAAADAAIPGAAGSSYHQRQQQQMLAHYQQLARQRQEEQDFAADPEAAEAMAIARAADEAEAAAVGPAPAAAAPAAAPAAAGVDDFAIPDLPEGINLEEARMLEAAMLGIPYQGRIPDFNAAAEAAPVSPGAMERRNLQAEQDAAYEESLALDRAKQESIAAAQAAEEARQQAEQEAAEAAARAEVEVKQQLAALLAAKRQRLPAEPNSGEPGSVSIVVRMPDGSRKGRRFRVTDQLQAVFDFVDVQSSEAAAAAGDADGGIKPGSYRLVTQFPRKVFVEGSEESLQQAGMNSDTALLLELS